MWCVRELYSHTAVRFPPLFPLQKVQPVGVVFQQDEQGHVLGLCNPVFGKGPGKRPQRAQQGRADAPKQALVLRL